MFKVSVAVIALVVTSASAFSQNVDYRWNFDPGGNFQSAILWVPFSGGFFGPGGETDRVHFDRGVPVQNRYTVTDVFGINEQLIVENDSLTLQFEGEYETVSPEVGFLASVVVGQLAGDTGDVRFTSNGSSEFQSQSTTIGFQVVSSGLISVEDPDLAWDNEDGMCVGWSGDGTLNILNGAGVSTRDTDIGLNLGSTGLVNITGPGSRYTSTGVLTVGSSGSGELLITDQGLLECFTFGSTIARGEDGDGCVTVDGPGSLWRARAIIVSLERTGFGANAELNIVNGGTCTSIGVLIGHRIDAFGITTVSGANSLLDIDGDLSCGESGLGILEILDQGQVNCEDAFVSRFDPGSSASARLTIDGIGSCSNVSESLSIGGDAPTGIVGGSALVEICNDGHLNVGNEVVLFPQATLELKSGQLLADSIRFEGVGGLFDFQGGTLTTDQYHGDLNNFAGTLAPGFIDAGSTTIFGDYSQQDQGILDIDIGGVGVGSEYDFVAVQGDVFLDGQLNIERINNFIPDNNQTFTLLDASSGSIFGFFDNAGDGQRIDTTDGLGSFLVRYGITSPNPDQIVLSEFEPNFILGDVNGDGVVNLLDVAPFVDAVSEGPYIPAADINQDGEVNLLDVAPFIALLGG